MERVKFELNLDIEDKNDTIRIDKENLKLDHTCADISYKPKTLACTEKTKYLFSILKKIIN